MEKRLPSFAPRLLMLHQIWCQTSQFETGNLCSMAAIFISDKSEEILLFISVGLSILTFLVCDSKVDILKEALRDKTTAGGSVLITLIFSGFVL